ncbi:MAG: hypothetical protein ACI9XO_001004 [Paraglaciecola sp.]|jgi:hypothetical protein
MKKFNYRSVFMAFLIVASLASYAFLSSVEVEYKKETAIELTDVKDSKTGVFMPDVELVKKVVAIGKAVLHPFAD